MPHLMTLVCILVICAIAPLCAYALSADLSQRQIDITSAYAGADVALFGIAPQEHDVIVVTTGPPGRITVRHKQPVLGVWVNRGSMTFQNVPRFYAVSSSRPLIDLLPADQLRAQTIGLDTLEFVTATSADQNHPAHAHYAEALVRSQQKKGLFQSAAGQIERVGDQLFRATLSLPATAPAGEYTISVMAVQQNRIVDETTLRLTVAQTGLIADTQHFVYRHGIWHGVLMLIVALALGAGGYMLLRRE